MFSRMRTPLIVISTIFVVMAALPLSAESAWTKGVSEKGGWFDIKKQWKTDKFHCWAASAANVIAWWQGNIDKEKMPAGVPQGPDAIFAAISNTFVDSGRGSDIAWKWYFGGCDLVEFNYVRDFRDPATARTSGRFWQDRMLKTYGWPKPKEGQPAYIDHGPAVDVSPDQCYADALAETFVRLFREGRGVTLDLSPGGAFPQGHTITLWGIDYEGKRIKAIYITDSDDGVTALKRYDVAYVTTQERIGDGKAGGTPLTTWNKTTIRLLKYCGSNQYGIQSWTALAK